MSYCRGTKRRKKEASNLMTHREAVPVNKVSKMKSMEVAPMNTNNSTYKSKSSKYNKFRYSSKCNSDREERL